MDWYLPGTKAGGPVRSIQSLSEVLKDKFEICIFTSNKDLGSDVEYKNIKTDQFIEAGNIKYYYFSPEKMNMSNIIAQIQLYKPDCVYLNSFWSYLFSIGIIKAKNKNEINCPIILAPRGMLSPGALHLKAIKKYIFLLVAKISNLYRNITFHASNKLEERFVKKQFPKAKVNIISNINAGLPNSNIRIKNVHELKLFYLSRIDRVKNLHFALEILAKIPSKYQIVYDIYGNMENESYWNECFDLIQKLPNNIKVKYKKQLAFDEVQSTISNYHALFLPTLNENFGHSIVESLMSGCAVICSDQTPWTDMNEKACGFAFPLTQKQYFIDAIRTLAEEDQHKFNQRSKQAINYISGKMKVEETIQQYINMFNGSIKN